MEQIIFAAAGCVFRGKPEKSKEDRKIMFDKREFVLYNIRVRLRGGNKYAAGSEANHGCARR